MSKLPVHSKKLSPTKGPYVHGVKASGTFVFVSGLVARNAFGQIIGSGDIRTQTRQTLQNIVEVVEAAGGRASDLVKMTVFLRDLADYDGMNEVRREMLAGCHFASATVQAKLHADDALIEIEAIAAIDP
jgi:2-iminobutanoate/2-iminopropanoate deaminase